MFYLFYILYVLVTYLIQYQTVQRKSLKLITEIGEEWNRRWNPIKIDDAP